MSEANEFIEQASRAIKDGQFESAAALARQALEADPSSADANIVLGIALAQSGQPDAATSMFRTAISIDPTSAKAYYNLATHQYQQQRKVEALEMAREALRLEPTHASARDLVALLESEGTAKVESPQPSPGSPYGGAPPSSAYGASPYVRTGYEQPAHAISWVEKLGGKWTSIAWTLCFVGLICFVGGLIISAPFIGEIMASASDPAAMQAVTKKMQESQTALGTVMGILQYVSWFGLLVWSIIDITDRKGNWLWIVPMLICCTCNFAPAPLYLLLGRRKI